MTATAKMRVLHMGNPTGMYGAERWIVALLKHLPADRVESHIGVIADDPSVEVAELCRYAERLGVPAAQFRSPGRLSLSAIGQLRRYIKEHEIDILHTHGYKTDIIGLLAAAWTPCLNVSTPHGWSVNAGIKLQVYETLDRLAFYFMDAVVPLSPDLYDGLGSWPGLRRRALMIRNGVDLDEIQEVLQAAEPARAADAQSAFTVGYIGQLIPRKRLDTLISAFGRLDAANVRLRIVGEGPQRAELERLAADTGRGRDIEFLGYREDRLELLAGFDVFVLPSSLEGIPRCLMEAMGAGVAVIASDIPGCRDLVSDGETGLLSKLGDGAQLAQALQRVVEDRTLRDRLGRNGQAFIQQNYSAAAMAARYAQLYEGLSQGIARGATWES